MTDLPFSKITCSIDIDADGKQHGYLSIPWSRDSSSWGSIRLPITVIKNGDGPTALFTGANHGDEYEGPLALVKLRQQLSADDITGRVIMIPALNLPAFRAGKRTSPIDGGNMNREFPGAPDGTITQMIADYVTTRFVDVADIVVDIHAGGRSLSFLPVAIIHDLPDPDHMARSLAALKAFGAPHGLILTELDDAGMLDTTVERRGKIFLSTELGGGATATPETVAIARRGFTNILKHVGILDDSPDVPTAPTLLHTPTGDNFVIAPTDGLFEMCVDIGNAIKAGDALARIHYLEEPERASLELTTPRNGILICRHIPGLIASGDCAAVIGEPWSPSA